MASYKRAIRGGRDYHPVWMLIGHTIRDGEVDQSPTDGGVAVPDQVPTRSRKWCIPCTADVCHGFVISSGP